jgi:hypothetical protein
MGRRSVPPLTAVPVFVTTEPWRERPRSRAPRLVFRAATRSLTPWFLVARSSGQMEPAGVPAAFTQVARVRARRCARWERADRHAAGHPRCTQLTIMPAHLTDVDTVSAVVGDMHAPVGHEALVPTLLQVTVGSARARQDCPRTLGASAVLTRAARSLIRLL